MMSSRNVSKVVMPIKEDEYFRDPPLIWNRMGTGGTLGVEFLPPTVLAFTSTTSTTQEEKVKSTKKTTNYNNRMTTPLQKEEDEEEEEGKKRNRRRKLNNYFGPSTGSHLESR
jgi:hypothetical protein